MKNQRRFFVLAGPNGAGKTTFGLSFIPANIAVFNGDDVFAKLVLQFPDIEPERLKGGVPVALEKARDHAIAKKVDFAFETNFSSDLTLELINHFRKEGYLVNLIYFGIDSPLIAESRVKSRVSLGGHDVPSETIVFNYVEGVRRVKDCINIFDNVEFVATGTKVNLVATYSKTPAGYILFERGADWFDKHFKSMIEGLIAVRETKETLKKGIDVQKQGEGILKKQRKKGRRL